MISSSSHADGSARTTTAGVHELISSVRGWLSIFPHLVVLEGKRAGVGLVLMLGFGVGALIFLIAGWFALIGGAVAALVYHDILGWIWSLLLVALANFAGAGGLVFLALRRRQDFLFSATRRQLGVSSTPAPTDALQAAELQRAESRVAASTASVIMQGQALKSKVRRQVTSPFVIGAVITAVATIGYFGVRRSAKAPGPRTAAIGSVVGTLKAARMLLPFVSALGAAKRALNKSRHTAELN